MPGLDSLRAEDARPHVITAPDQRVLILPRGRGGPAFQLPVHRDALALERHLSWLWYGFVAAVVAAVGMAAFTQRWWLLLIVVPLVIIRHTIESVLLTGLHRAEDALAVEAASPSQSSKSGWSVIVAAGVVLWYAREVRSDDGENTVPLAMGLIAVTLAGFEFVRAVGRWRADAEGPLGMSGQPDNKPIVPR